MKKFILVMVFVFLIALFIAFNYLLWDRESKVAEIKNLVSVNSNNDASISAQKREITALEEQVRGLKDRIDQLEGEKGQLQKEKESVISETQRTEAAFRDRVDFINVLKEYADIAALSQPIVSWAEALTQSNYEEAYDLEYAALPDNERPVKLSAYIDQMSATVSKIEITDVKLDKLRGVGNGEIYLFVKFNVKLAENPILSNTQFSEGENEMYVKIDYSKEKKSFFIATMIII